MLRIEKNISGQCIITFKDARSEAIEAGVDSQLGVAERIHTLLSKAGVPHTFEQRDYAGSTWDLELVSNDRLLTLISGESKINLIASDALSCCFHNVGEYI